MALLLSESVPLRFSSCTTSRCSIAVVCLSPAAGSKIRPQILSCWKQQERVTQADDTRWKRRRPLQVYGIWTESKASDSMPDCDKLCVLLLHYSKKGLHSQAHAIWDELWHSSCVPDIDVISELFNGYVTMGRYGEIVSILRQLKSRGFSFLLPKAYSAAISCFGRSGQLELMKGVLMEMKSQGLVMDSATANAFLVYYSLFGSLSEMEAAYVQVKRARILIESEGIRAMALAYIKNCKYYKLGEFTRDVGLGRINTGNLLWNLLLLSYAVNFKMKSLQREFLNMVDAGFCPDITTFNIRALAFSKMSLFWDLHLSIEHMNHEKVTPDLVTYGSVVDAYIDKRLGKSLPFALNKMNISDYPNVSTDQLVFDALGKGDFHSSSDALLEFSKHKKWTYKQLVATYIRKKYRSNQVFWNY